MEATERGLTRSGAIAWFVIGLILVLGDIAAGWVFFIIGLSYLARTTDRGNALVGDDPRTARWLILGLTLALVAVAAGLILMT
jgi:uracil-DNA glycosylase